MLIDLDSELKVDYRSGRDSLLGDFYLPCLNEAVIYDRAVGYFRSSLLHVTALAYADFVRRGGVMRLICSPQLTLEDYEAIRDGVDARVLANAKSIRDIDEILASPESLPAAKLLATLVAAGVLDVRIAFTADDRGIFHDKVGIFEDSQGRRVSFVGSANETWAAWGMNHESFEVFASWRGENELLRTRNHQTYFDRLWEGREPGVQVESLSTIARDRLLKVAEPDLDSAIDAVRMTAASKTQKRRTLMPHQVAVLDSWERNDHRGIVSFATGAGKTLTAIEAIRRWAGTGGVAVICVPGKDLHRQWGTELRQELTDSMILLCGAGHSSREWATLLPLFVQEGSPSTVRVVLTTNATFASHEFQTRLRATVPILLVIDELHRAGSASTLKAVESFSSDASLGLSATYRRQFDDAGTQRLVDAVGPVLDPVIGLAEAMVMGRLVSYDYRLHTMCLSDEEALRYEELTEKIRRAAAIGSATDEMSDHLQLLLIRRARILKQAAGKASAAVDILSREYRRGDKWLVYCDDTDQLQTVVSNCLAAKLPVLEYHSTMSSDREAVLASFTELGGIVVAIRCLDEGVDIPACDKALILASSTVEREYVQRRGRVLRAAPSKISAVVHDLLLVDGDGGCLTRGEALRAVEFARLSRNPGARAQLQLLLALSKDPVEADTVDRLMTEYDADSEDAGDDE